MLSADEARQLAGLRFGVAAAAPSAAPSASRVARARGLGTELHDFRRYQPGDDPRSIEWTIYQRLGQLVTRTYRADAHLRVHLLVDISRSMSIGSPDKLSCATRLAALLSYVAIRGRDAVGVVTFDDRIAQRVAPAHGRGQLFRALGALVEASVGGPSAIGRVLQDFGSVSRGPGLVVILSDFFDPAGVVDGLRYLLHRRLTPAVVQILSPEELKPLLTADAEFVDIEAPDAASLVVNQETVAAYQTQLTQYRASLAGFCANHGLPWMPIGSSDSFADLLLACHRAGVLAGQG
jgi:uncharacterized protein (DUF58 family)